MKKFLYIIPVLLLIVIPIGTRAYDCVFTYGENTSCTKDGKKGTDDKVSCSPGRKGAVSCSWSGITNSKVETKDNGWQTAASCTLLNKGSCNCGGLSSNVCKVESVLGLLFYKKVKSYTSTTTYTYDNKYTLAQTSNACGSASFSTPSASVKYWHSWSSHSGSYTFESAQPSKSSLGADQCNAFEGLNMVSYSSGKVYYRYSTWWTRCCGGGPGGGSTPPIEEHCYRKESGDIDAGTYKVKYEWAPESPGSGYSVVSSITDYKECNLQGIYCSTKPVKDNKKDEYKCVNEANSSKLQNIEKCTSNSNDFYKITCKENYNTTYSPKMQSNTFEIKVGQGIKYEINFADTNDCTGQFDYKKWKEAYDRANDLIARAKKSGSKAEIRWFTNKREEIINYIIDYNKWKPNDNIKINGNINIRYSELGTTYDHKDTFDVVKDENPLPDRKTFNCNTITYNDNKIKVCDFTWNIKTNYKLVPPQVYLTVPEGEVTKTKSTNTIDGGRKFYISNKADEGNATLSTEVFIDSNVAKYTVTNSNCNVKIIKDNEVYRIVEDSNAFVNKTRDVGVNWQNTKYDFTKIVDKETAKKDYVYLFTLSRSDITAIKSDNKSNKNAYLGTCTNDAYFKKYSGTMKKICNIIRSD